jgi:DNA-binding XRE family transcriptional regulator
MGQQAEPNRLRELRIRSRLTQEEVGDFLGVTPAVVSRHETGKKQLSHLTILKYARLYKVQTYELFQEPLGAVDNWTGEEIKGVRVRPGKNRLEGLRIRSRLTPEEVAKLLKIPVEKVLAHESGEEPLDHETVKAYASLYKVWTYEIFQKPIQGEDAWKEGRYRADEVRRS